MRPRIEDRALEKFESALQRSAGTTDANAATDGSASSGTGSSTAGGGSSNARRKGQSSGPRGEVAHGWHVLQRPRAWSQTVSHGRREDLEGPDTLHHRGDEDHE